MRVRGVPTCFPILAAALAGCTGITGVGDLEYTRDPPGKPSDIVWAKSYGDAVEDWAEAVAIAPGGDVMIAGAFAGIIDFGGGPIQSGNFKTDAFVARLDPAGGQVYSAHFDGGADDCVMDAALGASGQAVALIGSGPADTCESAGEGFWISLGTFPLGLTSYAVRVLDPAGAEIGTKVLCTACAAAAVGPIALAVDDADNIYVAGSFSGPFDLGGGPLPTGGAEDAFVAKLDANGNLLWASSFVSATMGHANITDIAVGPSGRVVVTGRFDLSISIGGAVYTGVLGDAFVAQLDASGEIEWSKAFPGAWAVAAPRIAAIPDGLLLTGDFFREVSFGGPPLMTLSATSVFSDAYLAKLDLAGNHVWSVRIGDPPGPTDGDQAGTSMAVDAAGNIYLAGAFTRSMDLDGTILEAGGVQDTFLAKLDPSGAFLSSKQWKGSIELESFQADQAIAVTEGGDAVMAGAFVGELAIDEQTLSSRNPMGYWDDAFAVRFSMP